MTQPTTLERLARKAGKARALYLGSPAIQLANPAGMDTYVARALLTELMEPGDAAIIASGVDEESRSLARSVFRDMIQSILEEAQHEVKPNE